MLKIAACASVRTPVTEQPEDVRLRLRTESGLSVRRVNRFIELALLGATQCQRAASAAFPAHTALYLSMDAGMVADTARVITGYIQTQRAPTPFEFMNISGSMAGFHVAQTLGLQGPQLSLHRNDASLEAALPLLALRSAPHRQALLGFVEEGVWPLHEQRQRLSWDGDFLECSHWLYLDADCARPLATIESCTQYEGLGAMIAALEPLERAGCQLSTSQSNHTDPDARALSEALRIPLWPSQMEGAWYSGGLTAQALVQFAQAGRAGRLLHVNQTRSGECVATQLRVDECAASAS